MEASRRLHDESNSNRMHDRLRLFAVRYSPATITESNTESFNLLDANCREFHCAELYDKTILKNFSVSTRSTLTIDLFAPLQRFANLFSREQSFANNIYYFFANILLFRNFVFFLE